MQIEELTRVLWLRRCGAQLQTLVSVPDITLPTKVCLVKAMVFSAAMYGCASCTMKKTEHRRTDAFELWCWRTGCWSPLDCKEIKPVNPVPWIARRSILKEIHPQYWLEGLMLKLKLQYSGHLMGRTNSLKKTLMLEDWGQEEKGVTGWDGWMASST